MATTSHSTLAFQLLGVANVRLNGACITEKFQSKVLALLVYLAMERHPCTRDQLIEIFWPDLERHAARSNMRVALYRMRQSLGAADAVRASRETLFLDSEKVELDAVDFLRITDVGQAMQQMASKVALYRGPFLDGLMLEDCPRFADWLMLKREVCHRHALGLLERLSDGHAKEGDMATALRFAYRYLELEPWAEAGHLRVMRFLALDGQAGAAQAQFETCQRILQQELDVQPNAQTLELFEQIKAGQLRPACASKWADDCAPAERRQVTALYCGFSYPCETDYEEMAERSIENRRLGGDTIRRMGGHVAQLHGGAILAYFGYPKATENAARLAVRAALALHRMSDAQLRVRVGLHTGMVVSDAELPDSMGLTSNHAIHLCNMQAPLVMSESTFELTQGFFHVEPLGLQTLRDIVKPVRCFRVLGESGAADRLQASLQRGSRLTPFVGREQEIKTLLALWRKVRQGAGQCVLVTGEAGVGKSRLVQILKERLHQEACTVYELRCFPESSQSPFHPLIVLIESLCGFVPGDAPDVKLGKLAGHLNTAHPQADRDALPLLAQLLSLPVLNPSDLSADKQKEKLGTLVLDLMNMQAAKQAVLHIIEDVHWVDPSTRELLGRLARQPGHAPIFTLITARPEFEVSWKAYSGELMTLGPLSDREMQTLLGSVERDIEQHTLHRIVARADGIALFAEEMAKMAQQGLENIPVTLHDLLAVQLDGLGRAKRIAQLAATIGRAFDLDLLREISPPDTALQSLLNELQASGQIVSRTAHQYEFKHALIQEAAYQSQTHAARQAAHQRIAQVLPIRFMDLVNSRPEVMAQHLTLGAMPLQAVDYWLKAGKRASQYAANTEAVAHFQAGLRLIAGLAPDGQSKHLEFSLQVGLGAVLHAVQGYGSAEASQAFQRAMVLCGQAASAELFQTLWGVWVGMMAHFPSALDFARKLQGVAQQVNDPVLRVQAHYVLGNNLFFLGQFDASRAESQAAMALYRPAQHESLVARFGENASVASGSFLSWALWFQGFPEQAQKASIATLAQARQMGHPHALAFTLAAAATLNRWAGNVPETQTLAQETLTLAKAHNFPFWLAAGMVMQGWALAASGHAQAMTQIMQSIVAMRASMNALTIIFLGIQADTHLHWGQHAEALAAVHEAFDALEKIGDRHYEAELYRLKGECLLGSGNASAAQAKAYFNKALQISRSQGARSLELRAAMSLARHCDQTALLSDTYAGFTEGFGTPDLLESRHILAGARFAPRQNQITIVGRKIRKKDRNPGCGDNGQRPI